jgi:hypothetical protein
LWDGEKYGKLEQKKSRMEGFEMAKAKIWFMDARARRFLESMAIKGREILEYSGWLDNLKAGRYRGGENPHGRSLQCGIPSTHYRENPGGGAKG